MAGGVAANASVRSALQNVAERAGLTLVCPPPRLCTDNGVMVAWAGAERLARGLAEPPPPPLRSANGAALPARLTVPVRDPLSCACAQNELKSTPQVAALFGWRCTQHLQYDFTHTTWHS